MLDIIIISFHAAMFGLIYYALLNGFLNEVAIRRLVRSSFRLRKAEILDLGVAYIWASLACLYILFSHRIIIDGEIYIKIFEVIKFPLDQIHVVSLASVILAFLFIGRVITKRKGVFYGRLHFSALFIACSIYIAYDVINAFIITEHTFQALYIVLSKRIYNFWVFSYHFAAYLLSGIMLLASIFEFALSISIPTTKSIFLVLEKFPSDFRVITGLSGAILGCIGQKLRHGKGPINRNHRLKYNEEIQNFCKNIELSCPNKEDKNRDWDDDGIYNKLKDILCNNEPYLFRWNQVPGIDSEHFLNCLSQIFNFDWIRNATIAKTNNNMAIKVSEKTENGRVLMLRLNDDRSEIISKITLEDDKNIINKFRVLIEDGECCIYNKSNIKNILCITRSLVLIDDTMELLLKSKKLSGVDVKVVVAPPFLALLDYDSALHNTRPFLGDISNFRSYMRLIYWSEYCKRLLRLNFYIKKSLLKTKTYYLGKVVFIIVEYSEDYKKEILFSIRDSGSLMRRVGLHSREPHIIKYFENLFYSVWDDDTASPIYEFKDIIDYNNYNYKIAGEHLNTLNEPHI